MIFALKLKKQAIEKVQMDLQQVLNRSNLIIITSPHLPTPLILSIQCSLFFCS